MADRLFQHAAVAIVGSVRIEALDMSFTVKKSLKKEPNQLELVIYNLNERSRSAVEKKGSKILLLAGYVDSDLSQIFAGDIRTCTSQLVGEDWVTTVKSGDGEKALKFDHTSVSHPPGTSVKDVLKSVVGAFSLNPGNTDEVAKEFADQQMKDGFTAHGRASNELDRLLRAKGLTWSVQDGQLQLLKPTAATRNPTVLLNSDTGLIGTPEKVTPQNEKEPGYVKAKSLLRGVFNPGSSVKLESKSTTGFFRVEKVEHKGDTAGQEWGSSLELKPLT